MKPSALDASTAHSLRAAAGWLDLGNPVEARAELLQVPEALARHPLVLEAWWLLHSQLKDWPAALAISLAETEVAPESPSGCLHQAYAMRRLEAGGLQAAWDILRPASDRFPDEPTIPYNLACYACQLGRMDEARTWLAEAVRLGGRPAMLRLALADTDLEPLWPELPAMGSHLHI